LLFLPVFLAGPDLFGRFLVYLLASLSRQALTALQAACPGENQLEERKWIDRNVNS
jgi:hypothetical protein